MECKAVHVLIILALSIFHLESSFNLTMAYDHFKLVQQWPLSFCIRTGRCSRNPPYNFTIHGLWPDNFGHSPLKFCTSDPYLPIMAHDPLLAMLDYAWPDLTQSTQTTTTQQIFWKRQWNKHETCCSPPVTQKPYFIKH